MKENLIVPEELIDFLCEQNVEGIHIRIGMLMMVIMMRVLR